MRALGFALVGTLAVTAQAKKPAAGGATEKPIIAAPAGAGAAASPARGHAGDVKGRGIGVGAELGEVSAVVARVPIAGELALDGYLGYSLPQGGVALGADVVYILARVANLGTAQLDLYGGGGVQFIDAGGPSGYHCHNTPWSYCHTYADPARPALTVRVPIGAGLMLQSVPLELFAEVAVGLRYLLAADSRLKTGEAKSSLRFFGALGARYYF